MQVQSNLSLRPTVLILPFQNPHPHTQEVFFSLQFYSPMLKDHLSWETTIFQSFEGDHHIDLVGWESFNLLWKILKKLCRRWNYAQYEIIY